MVQLENAGVILGKGKLGVFNAMLLGAMTVGTGKRKHEDKGNIRNFLSEESVRTGIVLCRRTKIGLDRINL